MLKWKNKLAEIILFISFLGVLGLLILLRVFPEKPDYYVFQNKWGAFFISFSFIIMSLFVFLAGVYREEWELKRIGAVINSVVSFGSGIYFLYLGICLVVAA